MARTLLTPITVLRNQGTTIVADATTIDKRTVIDAGLVTAGIKIPYAHNDHLMIHITNTTTKVLNVTVQASTDDNAYMKGQGDLVVSIPRYTAKNAETVLMGLEQPRFCYNVAGVNYLYLDFETAFEGFVVAYDTLPL